MKDVSVLAFNIIEWVLVGICVFYVVARLAVRTWKRMWMFWQSEAWLILASVNFTGMVAGTTYFWVSGLDIMGDTQDVGYIKFQWCTIFLSEVGYYFPRFSLLAFYNELFPISEEKLRKALYVVAAFNIFSFFLAFFVNLFWCGLPISKNWAPNNTGETCSLILENGVYKVTWPFNVTSEILVFILPFGMFQTLGKTPTREKIALGCLFGIGIISIATTTARFYFAMQSIFQYSTVIVGSTEIVSQIVVCAAPALRPLLPLVGGGWGKLKSIVTGHTVSSEDERTLNGSYNTRGGKEKDASRNAEDNMPELAAWNSNGDDTTHVDSRHSREV